MVSGRADGLVIRGDYSMFAYDKKFYLTRTHSTTTARVI